MFGAVRRWIQRGKTTLFSFNNEPFSKFSILLIIILDIFLFMTISMGIDAEQVRSPSVYSKYPAYCTRHFDTQSQESRSDTYHSFSLPKKNAHGRMTWEQSTAPICQELYQTISGLTASKSFQENKRRKEQLLSQKRAIVSQISSITKRYNTALFEKVAKVDQKRDQPIREKYDRLLAGEKAINDKLSQMQKVSDHTGYPEYVAFIKNNRAIFQKAYDSYLFWQPFLSFAYLLKFTLPLLFFAFLAYRFSTNIHRRVSVPNRLVALISSHIMMISLLPIVWEMMHLVLHIIPDRFFEKVIAFLSAFGFIFLGYYFLIFLAIVMIGFLIFLIQKSVAKREKLRRELKEKTLYIDAYNQHLCPNCKNRAAYHKPFCAVCGEALNRTCTQCQAQTPRYLPYCQECGE